MQNTRDQWQIDTSLGHLRRVGTVAGLGVRAQRV